MSRRSQEAYAAYKKLPPIPINIFTLGQTEQSFQNFLIHVLCSASTTGESSVAASYIGHSSNNLFLFFSFFFLVRAKARPSSVQFHLSCRRKHGLFLLPFRILPQEPRYHESSRRSSLTTLTHNYLGVLTAPPLSLCCHSAPPWTKIWRRLLGDPAC